MRRLSAIVTTSLIAAACGDAQTAPTPVPSDLATAPTRVTLAGASLHLDASLWRDFMPVAPPDGRPLNAVLRVRTEDGSSVPATVRADMAWVLNGRDVWQTVPREEQPRSTTSPAYELVAREGPKWGPGVSVDVVVRMRESGGRDVLLRASSRPIEAAY